MDGNERELAYYRAVEDFFARLRGTVHVLSPRDFQLLRTWWREGVPLAAVTAGIAETFSKKREREDGDPVVSLAYCRHAVQRHARRLAEGAVGRDGSGSLPGATDQDLALLAGALEEAELHQREQRPAVARVLASVRERLALLEGGDQESVETGLFALEEALLEECWAALDAADRARIEASADRASEGGRDEASREYLAHRDREIRRLLGLPRLELA